MSDPYREVGMDQPQLLKEPKEPILQFFKYQHLPDRLQAVSKPFSDLADWICKPTSPQSRAHRRPAEIA